ncbi:MAG: hypothetical protein IT536_02535 [Hyphomicrobiales bacterium]|nr:hypothetical protein [Hyphomicrobiales bacterium]
MSIDRRRFLASATAGAAATALPATAVWALDGPVFFAKNSLVPDWLNRSGNIVWFGVDVMVSPRSADEPATVWLTRRFGEGSGCGISFLATMTTRELAMEREEPLAIYTVAPVRPLQLGECMAYLKEWAHPLDTITSNAVWTGSPADYWVGVSNSRYQLNNGRKYEGVEEFAWIA